MKKFLLVVVFIIFIIILTEIDPTLSFTRTGGINFDNGTPSVVSNFRTEDVIEWFESEDEKSSIIKRPLYTTISGSDIHLGTYFVDVEYYFGQELSKEFLIENDFPEQIITTSQNKGEDKLIAVKATYLDLTTYGIKDLKKLILSGPTSAVENRPEYSSLQVFEYKDYLIFLKDNILYYVLNG